MRPLCLVVVALTSLFACEHPRPRPTPSEAAPPPPAAAPAPSAPVAAAPAPAPAPPAPTGPRVTLLGTRGPATLAVRLAVSKQELDQGLRHVKYLPPDDGMLFVFDEDQDHTFWTKDTPLALDLIFIDLRMDVVGVVRNVRPLSETTRSCGRLSRYVLEVNAGWADAHGIDTGARAAFTDVKVP